MPHTPAHLHTHNHTHITLPPALAVAAAVAGLEPAAAQEGNKCLHM